MRFSAMWRRNDLGKAIAAAALLLSVPAVASATVYTPNPADLNDLDHHKAYAWKIDVSGIKTDTVTSATLQFKQLYNWDSNANRLYIHLFDNVTNIAGAGLYSWEDNPNDSSMIDSFNPTPGWVVGNTNLTNRAFDQKGKSPSSTGPGDQMTDNGNGTFSGKAPGDVNWSAKTDGCYANCGPDGYTDKYYYTYTYTFTGAQLATLNSYIDDGWIALGLDPDCHFYNTGVSLSLTSTPNVPAVPEPASVLLLGTGLAWAGYRRFRRGAVKA